MPFSPLFSGRVPLLEETTEKKAGTLILTSLLEDLVENSGHKLSPTGRPWTLCCIVLGC